MPGTIPEANIPEYDAMLLREISQEFVRRMSSKKQNPHNDKPNSDEGALETAVKALSSANILQPSRKKKAVLEDAKACAQRRQRREVKKMYMEVAKVLDEGGRAALLRK